MQKTRNILISVLGDLQPLVCARLKICAYHETVYSIFVCLVEDIFNMPSILNSSRERERVGKHSCSKIFMSLPVSKNTVQSCERIAY